MKPRSLLLCQCAGLLAALCSLGAQAQGVTIGAAGAPAASAALEVRNPNQGLLLPRLTAARRVAIASPVAGLRLFQPDNTPGVYYGNGTGAFADGTDAAAQFTSPSGVACDVYGNVYVADTQNHRIRRIVAATHAVGVGLAGVDVLPDRQGAARLLETNLPCGFATFPKLGVDVPGMMIEDLTAKAARLHGNAH